MAEEYDYGLRNLDWLRTMHWPLKEGEHPVESMQQVQQWAQTHWPSISEEETVIQLVKLPLFEAAPPRLQGEGWSDFRKIMEKSNA